MDEILQQMKAEIAQLKAERDMWHARAFAMFWRLPADTTCGELRKDTEKAMAFLGYR